MAEGGEPLWDPKGKAGVNSTTKDPIFMEISCVQLSTSKLASMLQRPFFYVKPLFLEGDRYFPLVASGRTPTNCKV